VGKSSDDRYTGQYDQHVGEVLEWASYTGAGIPNYALLTWEIDRWRGGQG